MRLIDADALIEIFNHDLKCFKTNGKTEAEMYISVADMRKMIEEQPTAYDVSKVVEELKEEREYSYADFEEYVQEKSPCLDAEYDDYFHRGLERAVVIVKRGGVE